MPAASALLPSPQNTPVCFRLCASRPSTGILRKNLRPQRREIFRLFKAAGRRNTGVFQGRQRSKTENLPLCGALYSDYIVYAYIMRVFINILISKYIRLGIICRNAAPFFSLLRALPLKPSKQKSQRDMLGFWRECL